MFEISKLKEKKLSDLQQIAEELNISKFKTLKKLDLVYKILDHQADNPEIKKTTPKQESNPESNPKKLLLSKSLILNPKKLLLSKSLILLKRSLTLLKRNLRMLKKTQKAILDRIKIKIILEMIKRIHQKDLKHLTGIGIIEIVIENLTTNLMQSLRVKAY